MSKKKVQTLGRFVLSLLGNIFKPLGLKIFRFVWDLYLFNIYHLFYDFILQ